jgi:hypothetical protein
MKPGPENAAIAAVRRPAPSAPQSGAAVRQLPATDLLAAIDVGRDRVRGDWRKEGGALIAPPVPAAALAVPGAVPSEYTLTLAAERLSGNDSLTVGLVVGGRQVAVVLEGWGNRASGLALVRGQRELKSMEAVFKPGAASTIVCTVRKSRIQIACEGSPLMDWSGDPADLSLIARYWTGVPPDRLFLGAWESSFCISRLEVVPLTE